MILLKSLIKESAESLYWWMDHTGKLFPVPRGGHHGWALDYLTKTGFDSSIAINPYEEMYKKGWIRVGAVGMMGKLYIEYNHIRGKRISSTQTKALQDLAWRVEADEIHDDTEGTTELVKENDMSKISYSAVVLNEHSQEKLLHLFQDEVPMGWKRNAHHMTIKLDELPPEQKKDINKEVKLHVVAIGKSDKAIAVKVEIPNHV